MALKPASLQWSPEGRLESPAFGDIYFQPGKGADESRHVFLEGNRLPARFSALRQDAVFCVGELGFGTGLNFLLTAALFRETAPRGARLVYFSIEKHPLSRGDLEKVYAAWPAYGGMAAEIMAQYPPLVEGFHSIRLPGADLVLVLGDVAEALPEIAGRFDAWYLDGFAPAKNPDMWAESLFPLVAARTRPGGTLATFSAAGEVRRGLAAAGFAVEKQKGFGAKRDMTVARLPGESSCSVSRRNITVLGAGIAGAGAARAFSRRGHAVTVQDRAESHARGASGNPYGIVYPKMTVDRTPMGMYYSHGFCLTRAMLERMKPPSWLPCGVLHLDLGAEDTARTQKLLEMQGYPPDFARVGEYDGATGLFHPSAGCVAPPEFCAALLDDANITTLYGEEAGALDTGADITVVALGNASRDFSATSWLPLQSLRGQMSVMPAVADIPHVICHKGFVTPAIGGRHYFGATFQKEPEDTPEIRPEDHADNIAALQKHVPAFAGKALEATGGRAGYRATTPDKLPMTGPAPDYDSYVAGAGRAHEGLYISTGFGAHGLAGGPLAGEMIAAMALGEPLPVPASLAAALAPERFIRRALRRGQV